MKLTSFRPGETWLDSGGNRIQAHAGYMLYEDDTFYWYGENKERSQSEREIWHWGVRLYSSKDLYNWQEEGIIVPPEIEDVNSPLHYQSKMDRPHILYNKETGYYVMWIKIMTWGTERPCYAIILRSKSIKGPFEMVKEEYYPNGFALGDFELVQDENSGKAYLIYERPHFEMVITPLSKDYLSVEETNYKTYFHNGHPPYIREAPATFRWQEKIFMITSGTTAKFPNQSEVAVADEYMGDWEVLGDPCEGDVKQTTFDSQISCIFKHPKKKNLYIAMADRWLVDLPNDLPNIKSIYERTYTDLEGKVEFDETKYTQRNTSIAEYVWLPIEIQDGRPIIRWYDEWRWEDFE